MVVLRGYVHVGRATGSTGALRAISGNRQLQVL